MALVTFLCFAASRSPGAYTALAVMETVITALFFLLYFLKLDQQLSWLFWPLAVSTGWPWERGDPARFAVAGAGAVAAQRGGRSREVQAATSGRRCPGRVFLPGGPRSSASVSEELARAR